MIIHVVRPGETLSSIAREYGVNPHRLAQDNGVWDERLAIGQTLVVRFPRRVHVVAPGQTLSSIAQSYGLTLRRLWQNNISLKGSQAVTAGQSLVLSYWEEPIASARFNGYADPSISQDLLRSQLPYLTDLSPFTYGLTADLSVFPLADEALLAAAQEMGVRPLLHLSTLTESGQFSSERAVSLLSAPDQWGALVSQIRSLIYEKGYRGVDVDFEFLPAQWSEAYADFLSFTRQQISPLPLWAALAPKTSSDQRGLLYEGHDYAAVGAACDAVLLMTYEWGYTYGPPMAVAPLPNVRAVLDYALTQIPREKILLGLPNYGYDWPLPFQEGVTKATSLSGRQAVAIAIEHQAVIEYDETAQSPFFDYQDESGISHQVWFEDARSFAAKLRLIQEYGFLGAGIWNLMRPDTQLWQVLNALYQVV